MKKLFLPIAASMMTVFILAGCGGSPVSSQVPSQVPDSSLKGASASVAPTDKPEKIMAVTLNANKEKVEIEVPYDPQRIAVMDMAALDILDNLNLGDRVIGMAKNTKVEYLKAYFDDDNIQNLGTLHEPDLEAMMEAEPEIIIIGGRMAEHYDALSEIAPVLYMGTDYQVGLVQSITENAENIASIFGMENVAEEKMAGFAPRIEALAEKGKGKTAVIGVVTSGGFNTLGNGSRCSLIGDEIGFENLAADVDSTHGNEASFEILVELKPEYIFVLDRDAAIAAEGAQLAPEVMENELVQSTDAYKNDRIIYLSPEPWYLAEGGITSLDAMLKDLETSKALADGAK